MESPVELRVGDFRQDAAAAVSPDQIRAQVARIVDHPSFSSAERTKKFLRYIVEQTLLGNAKRLKQYNIATRVLDREESFNPDADPVVRLEAGKLRRALENYYLRAGAHDDVRISVPKGAYIPIFERHEFDAGSVPAAAAITRAIGPVDANVSPLSTSAQRLLVLRLTSQHDGVPCGEFARGLFEQLVVELTRYRDVTVIAFDDAVRQTDVTADPIVMGQEAQARYVLAGSVRQSGDQFRVTVRLHEIRSSSIIWTESFDADTNAADILSTQDKIARHIAGTVADYYGVISYQLSIQSVYTTDQRWNVQNAILRHRYLARTLTEGVYRLARADLEQGARLAPHHPMVWAALAHTIFYGNVLGFDQDPDWLALTYRFAQRAFELDHKCAYAHVVMALHELFRRDFEEVFEICKRIMADNPHAPSTMLSAGFFRALAGEWDSGTKMLTEALGILLHPPGWAYRITFLNFYRKKDYNRALHEIRKYNAPEHFTPPVLRAAALAQLGRIKDAEIATADVLRICPRFREISGNYFRYLVSFDDLSDHLMVGLRKAGLIS